MTADLASITSERDHMRKELSKYKVIHEETKSKYSTKEKLCMEEMEMIRGRMLTAESETAKMAAQKHEVEDILTGEIQSLR
jgi:hypothetical protein